MKIYIDRSISGFSHDTLKIESLGEEESKESFALGVERKNSRPRRLHLFSQLSLLKPLLDRYMFVKKRITALVATKEPRTSGKPQYNRSERKSLIRRKRVYRTCGGFATRLRDLFAEERSFPRVHHFSRSIHKVRNNKKKVIVVSVSH